MLKSSSTTDRCIIPRISIYRLLLKFPTRVFTEPLLIPSCFLFFLLLLGPAIPGYGQGFWGDDKLISSQAGNPAYPQLATDGQAGAIIAWQNQSLTDCDIFAQRVDAFGNTLWAENGVPVCDSNGNQLALQIISDGSGGAILAWQDQRTGGSDIYAQRIDGNGNVLWAVNGVAACYAPGEQLAPRLASDGNGGAIITWQDLRDATPKIYAQRIDGSGNIRWEPNGNSICGASGNQHAPRVIVDGMGGGIIMWQDDRNGNEDLFAQRINGGGANQWAADGVTICAATADQINPQLVPDQSGGAILVWEDYRSGNGDVYSQKIDHSGNRLWTTDGVGVSKTFQDQFNPLIISDGTNGAIIAWQDQHLGHELNPGESRSIKAQKIDGAGIIQWLNDGVFVTSTDPNIQPQIITDARGGAVLGWITTGEGSYACLSRLGGDGSIKWFAYLRSAGWVQTVSDGNGGTIAVIEHGFIYAQRVIKPLSLDLFPIQERAVAGEIFHAAIWGKGISDVNGAVVGAALQREGVPDIVATNLVIVNENHCTCDFDLTSAATGGWYLAVWDNLNQTAVSVYEFTIYPPTPIPTATRTSTPTLTPSPTFTESPTATVSHTPTVTPSATESFTPTVSTTATFTCTDSPTVTATPTETSTPTESPSATTIQTDTPTLTPSPTFTPTTFSHTPTATPTGTVTPTPPIATATSVYSPIQTQTTSATATPTAIDTPAPTRTSTAIGTQTVTCTATPSLTATAVSPIATVPFTATITPTVILAAPTPLATPRINRPTSSQPFLAFPNPATDHITFVVFGDSPAHVKLVIYNLAGQRISELEESNSQSMIVWKCQGVAAGVYIARLFKDGQELGKSKIAVVR